MKHLEAALSSHSYLKRCGIFILYLAIIGVALVVQSMVSLVTLSAAYFVEFGEISNIFFDLQNALTTMDKNLLLLALLIPFAVALFLLVLFIKLIHKRSFAETINGRKNIRWGRISFGFALWFLLMGAHTLLTFLLKPDDFTLQFNFSQFLPLLIISLSLIPLQTTFEEVLVRGYLAQGVSMLSRSRWMSLLFPALLFTLLHIANPEIGEYGMGIMLTTYFTMAMLWGLTTILDDGIELGIGMHAANNLFISLFTTQKGAAFESYAVFEVAKSDPYIALLELIVLGTIVLVIFFRKYKWSFNTLNQKIENPSKTSPSVS